MAAGNASAKSTYEGEDCKGPVPGRSSGKSFTARGPWANLLEDRLSTYAGPAPAPARRMPVNPVFMSLLLFSLTHYAAVFSYVPLIGTGLRILRIGGDEYLTYPGRMAGRTS